MDREVKAFAERLQGEILDLAATEDLEGDGTSHLSFKENAFTQIFINYLTDAGVLEDGEVCFLQSRPTTGRIKVNGYGMRGDDDCADLFVSIYQHHQNGQGPERVATPDLKDVLGQCVRFFTSAIAGLHLDMEPSTDAYAMARRIYDLRGRISRVRFYVFTNGVTGERRQLLRAKPGKQYGMSIQVWDIERLFRCVGSGLPREAIEIDFVNDFGAPIPCLAMPVEADDYMAYLAIVPGDVLYALYDDYGARLLELNVRSYLQLRGKVNSGIRDTLRTEPQNFFAYNNGISATADVVETFVTEDGSLAVRRITGLQIVNGGQTTASIHRARRNDKDDLSRVFVQAKITVANPELLPELVPKVARFANSQNKIQDADFSANDPFHVELQRHSEAIWAPGEQSRWFYERARGQYQVQKAREATTPARRKAFEERIPARQVITKTDLAKYAQVWDQRPEIVGRGSQKNFVAFMDELRRAHGKDWRPTQFYFRRVVALTLLYKAAEKVAKEEKFSAYRANIIAYSVAYLSSATERRIDLDEIWRRQAVPDVIVECLRAWSHDIAAAITTSAGCQNVTEWCKKPECWRHIRSLRLRVPDEVVEVLANPMSDLGANPDIEQALREALACPQPSFGDGGGAGRGMVAASSASEPPVMPASDSAAGIAAILTQAVDDLMVKVPFELLNDAGSSTTTEEKIAAFERLLASSLAGDGRMAVHILEKTEEHLYVDSVVSALRDVNHQYAPSLLAYLVRIDPSRAFHAAKVCLGSSVAANRRSAALALGQLGSHDAVRILAKMLSSPDSQERITACRALVDTHAAGVVAALAKRVLNDPVREVRKAAASCLGTIHTHEAVLCLTKAAIADPDPHTRAAAVGGLGRSGDPDAVEPLVEALSDADPLVRVAAAEALGLLADCGACACLVDIALGDEDEEVRIAACTALGHCSWCMAELERNDARISEDGESALKTLREISQNDSSGEVRAAAAVAAQQIADLIDVAAADPGRVGETRS